MEYETIDSVFIFQSTLFDDNNVDVAYPLIFIHSH